MSSIELPRLIYLGILLGVILFYFLLSNRRNLGQVLRHAILWGLIFIGTIAAIGLWQDVRPNLAPRQMTLGDGIIEIERDHSGHYVAFATINGKEIDFLVDTGATNIVLSSEDAQRIGINLSNLIYTGQAFTANGVVRTARITLNQFDFGGIRDQNITAYVTDGAMSGSLLGMDYLNKFSKIEITGRKLILTR